MYHRPVMRVDYHVHTGFSSDCDVPMQEQCQAAMRAGIAQIAFTEHEDNNPKEYMPFSFNHPAYYAEMERCRALYAGQLIIRAGIEISEPHRYADAAEHVLRRYPWDFVLGSLHWLTPDVNTMVAEFFNGFGDWRESFRAYFREMLVMAQRGDFDVLAHLDYPARYGARYYGDAYDIREYEPQIRAVLRTVIDRGKGIEINTGSLRKRLPNPCPPQAVVDWYHELGGTILTVGSDAHRSRDVGADIPLALRMAHTAGFTHIAVYERRQPAFVEIGDWRSEIGLMS
jgi:histidinol-phosphatase (PHP family)